MKSAAAITEIETRAEQAERRALTAEIQLGITKARLADFEKSAATARDAQATSAVRQLVSRGAIKPGDVFTQHEWCQKFLTNAALIPLCLCRPFNQRKRVTT